MGGVVSADDSVENNYFLLQFAGLRPISDNDPFWNRLLSFNLKINCNDRNEVKHFERSLDVLLQSLMYNTQTTGNFAAFVRMLLRRATEIKVSDLCNNTIFLWQMRNSILILLHICKFLTQRLSENEFVKMFDKQISSAGDDNAESSDEDKPGSDNQYENAAEEILDVLVCIITELPVNDKTLPIHIEVVKCIMAILSSQLYSEKIISSSIFFNILMNGRCSTHATDLTKILLTNYLHYNTPYKTEPEKEPESIVLGLAASIWSMVQTVAGYDDVGVGDDNSATIPASSLGDLSVLLLLNLVVHQNSGGAQNRYKEAISGFQNSQEISSIASSAVAPIFNLDYTALYDRLCATVNEQPPMLLLYLLLHQNSAFRNFVLSRINLENLVIPVLRVLYEGSSSGGYITSSNSHHVYLALIIILILSEDDFFCKIVHETMIKDTSWYHSERLLGEMSLGGLIIMIFIRTIQMNTVKTRDRYLHTNCLATLANMAAYFKQLSPTVCQKLIGLLEVLSKRHAKLIEHMRMSADYDIVEEKQVYNYHQDITALEEGIRTVLEICNSCLTSNLRHNPHFIYTILYHRDIFDEFKNHAMFQDLIWNISAVINHFASRVQAMGKDASVTSVLAVIKRTALQWPTDRLKKFPELKFKYVEDDNTVEFFVPYVWRLIFQHSSLYWEPNHVKFFNAFSSK